MNKGFSDARFYGDFVVSHSNCFLSRTLPDAVMYAGTKDGIASREKDRITHAPVSTKLKAMVRETPIKTDRNEMLARQL